MLDLSNTRSIRRTSLYSNSSSSSRSSSPRGEDATAATLLARYHELYGDEGTYVPPNGEDKPASARAGEVRPVRERRDEDPAETSYEFRLFSASKPSANPQSENNVHDETVTSVAPPTSHRVVLSSPNQSSSGRFVKPRRPLSSYFTSALPQRVQTRQRARFAASTLSGFDILDLSQRLRYPGCAVPWRVSSIHLGRSALKSLAPSSPGQPNFAVLSRPSPPNGANSRRKSKPNKKRRSALRIQAQRLDAERAVVSRVVEAKQAEEREKKTRRNREKKVKRKARQKAQKVQG